MLLFHLPWEIVSSMLQPVVSIVALALGGLVTLRIVKTSDKDKAALLAQIANDACALLLLQYPKGTPAIELLQLLVKQISAAAGVPTTNLEAIKRAAAAALAANGVSTNQ